MWFPLGLLYSPWFEFRVTKGQEGITLYSLSPRIPLGVGEMSLINSVVIVFRAVSLLDWTQWIFLSAEALKELREEHLDLLSSVSHAWSLFSPELTYSDQPMSSSQSGTIPFSSHHLLRTFLSAKQTFRKEVFMRCRDCAWHFPGSKEVKLPDHIHVKWSSEA